MRCVRPPSFLHSSELSTKSRSHKDSYIFGGLRLMGKDCVVLFSSNNCPFSPMSGKESNKKHSAWKHFSRIFGSLGTQPRRQTTCRLIPATNSPEKYSHSNH